MANILENVAYLSNSISCSSYKDGLCKGMKVTV